MAMQLSATLTGTLHCHSQVRNDSPEQHWHLQAGISHIQLAGPTLCIDAGEESKKHESCYVTVPN